MIIIKRAFFFDIDGTLIDCKREQYDINEETRQIINKIQEQNLAFIATGRPKCFIMDSIRTFPFQGFITCNGAYIELNGKCVNQKIMTQRELEILMSFCNKNGFEYFLCSHDYIYVSNLLKKKVQNYAKKWQMSAEIMKDKFNIKELKINGAMIVTDTIEDAILVERTMKKYFEIGRHNGEYSFDINIKGVTKGSAIKELVRKLNIPLDLTVAFGDGRNDIEMIKTVGLGVAMGNSVHELKEIAKEITDDVLENGVGKVLARYL